jgi:hypothetical protein
VYGPAAALVAADINRDGMPDLLAMPRPSYGGTELLNSGNGTFVQGRSFFDWGGQSPNAMAVGDINGDGKLDIVFANQDTSDPVVSGTWTGSVTVELGNGQGGFVPPSGTPNGYEIIFPSAVVSLALADVDGSGKPDIVAVTAGGLSMYVARNMGNGYFGDAQAYGIPGGSAFSGYQVATADFNGDGKPDIFVTDSQLNSVSVLLNNGDGTFAAAQTYSVGGSPTALAVGDFNRDGNLDLVTANANSTVSVLLNNGNGTFGTAQNFAVAGPANSVAVGDFNHDGSLDVVTTGSEMDLLQNNGNGTFGAYQKVGPAGSNVVAGNFVSAGFFDLAQIDASGNNIDVLLNNLDPPLDQVSASFGSITYNKKTKSYSETVTLTNNSVSALTGPLSLELTNLPSGVVLTDATGTINGKPYIRFLGSGKTLNPGASLTITLTFTAASLSDITFGTAVVAL